MELVESKIRVVRPPPQPYLVNEPFYIDTNNKVQLLKETPHTLFFVPCKRYGQHNQPEVRVSKSGNKGYKAELKAYIGGHFLTVYVTSPWYRQVHCAKPDANKGQFNFRLWLHADIQHMPPLQHFPQEQHKVFTTEIERLIQLAEQQSTKAYDVDAKMSFRPYTNTEEGGDIHFEIPLKFKSDMPAVPQYLVSYGDASLYTKEHNISRLTVQDMNVKEHMASCCCKIVLDQWETKYRPKVTDDNEVKTIHHPEYNHPGEGIKLVATCHMIAPIQDARSTNQLRGTISIKPILRESSTAFWSKEMAAYLKRRQKRVTQKTARKKPKVTKVQPASQDPRVDLDDVSTIDYNQTRYEDNVSFSADEDDYE